MAQFFYKLYKYLMPVIIVPVLASCISQSTKNEQDQTSDIEINEPFGIDEELTQKFNQAVIYIRQENYKEAIPLLKTVTQHTDKHSAAYINLGIAYSSQGQITEAETALVKALTINPLHPVAQNELGLLYRKTGRFDDARKVYQQLITKYPLFLPARKNMGILCDIFIQDLECAIEHYQAYMAVKADDKKVSLWLADVKLRAGRN